MQTTPYRTDEREAKATRARDLRQLTEHLVRQIERAAQLSASPPAVRVYVTLELSHDDVRELCTHLQRRVLTRLALRAWARHTLRTVLDSLRGAP